MSAPAGDTACKPALPRTILLTGASGYVGGRLLGLLLQAGHRVRCLARKPEYLAARVPDGAEIVGGDVLHPESLTEAMRDCDAAYYLVHSMGSAGSFEDEDRRGASNFAAAAAAAGLGRIVYLGGLGDESEQLSAHLRSRHEVGRLLTATGVPVVEFRASVVIGSGSLSFELVRALVERLPVMITPSWVSAEAQPIAIDDLLAYLLAALDVDTDGTRVFEIGGADVVSYADIMAEYARQRGLRRTMIPVPLLTPRLSSLWLGLVTPVYARVGRKLIASIEHRTVVRSGDAARVFSIKPMGFREAVAAALGSDDREAAQTRWSDAISAGGTVRNWSGVRFGNRLVDSRSITVEAEPAAAFAAIARIGGKRGWYHADWLWKLRGLMDLMVGGIGIRRGRRDAEILRVGDTVDWWRVEAFEPARRLRLVAEMKLPGRAWLDFEVDEAGPGRSRIRQTAIFDPVGLAGLAYWYAVAPFHNYVFGGMLEALAAAAREPEKD